jgi:hypothetical protein
MFLLYANKPLPEPGTGEARELLAAWTSATSQMAEAGVLIDCGPLQPPTASTTVSVRDGETLLTDGPAAEIKEHFGGFTLIECTDLDEALKWAARVPTASDGRVEVRPLVPVAAPPVVANTVVADAVAAHPVVVNAEHPAG